MTTPIYAEKEREKPCKSVVQRLKKNKKNPYEVILAREVRNWFDHSQMIAVVHINPINGEDFFDARVELHKNGGMQLKKYGDSIMNLALKDTKFEVLLKTGGLQTFSTGFIFSTEHNKVATIIKILKKFPQMHLLCGVVENRLLSKNEFVDYAKMPNIDIVRSQLVNVLNMAGSQLVQNLSSHQSNLVNVLDAHVRQNEKPTEEAVQKLEEPEPSA